MPLRSVWVAVILVLFAAAASAAPAPPPPDPHIVYVERGAWNKIIVMNTDGSNKKVLRKERAFLTEPVWAPDGSAIVYTVSGVGLYRVSVSTGAATLLMTDAQCGSGVPRLPNDSGFCWNPRVSPSGSRIAVIDGGLSAPRVWALPSSGGAPVVLYTGTQGYPFYDVAWSLDETKIAIVETVGGGLPDRILVIDLATGTRTTVVEGPFDRINYIDWGHVGAERIVFDAGDTNRNVYTIDVGITGASPVLVTQGAHPSFSPDNASIVYVKGLGTPGVQVARLNLITRAAADLAKGVEPDWKK